MCGNVAQAGQSQAQDRGGHCGKSQEDDNKKIDQLISLLEAFKNLKPQGHQGAFQQAAYNPGQQSQQQHHCGPQQPPSNMPQQPHCQPKPPCGSKPPCDSGSDDQTQTAKNLKIGWKGDPHVSVEGEVDGEKVNVKGDTVGEKDDVNMLGAKANGLNLQVLSDLRGGGGPSKTYDVHETLNINGDKYELDAATGKLTDEQGKEVTSFSGYGYKIEHTGNTTKITSGGNEFTITDAGNHLEFASMVNGDVELSGLAGQAAATGKFDGDVNKFPATAANDGGHAGGWNPANYGQYQGGGYGTQPVGYGHGGGNQMDAEAIGEKLKELLAKCPDGPWKNLLQTISQIIDGTSRHRQNGLVAA